MEKFTGPPLKAIEGFLTKAGEFMPTLIGALLILLIGYIIAKIVKWGIQKLLRAVKFDDLADNVGIGDFLRKGQIGKTASGLLSSLFYWIIMFTVLVTFFNNLGLEVVSDLLNKVILFIPNIIIACILLIVGMYLANFVRTVVEATLRNGNIKNPELYGRIARIVVLFFTFSIVLTQMSIGTEVINNVVSGLINNLGLAIAAAVGISFGIGGQDWAKGVINRNFKNNA